MNLPVVIHTSCQRAEEGVEASPGGQAGLPGGGQTQPWLPARQQRILISFSRNVDLGPRNSSLDW